MRTNLSQFRLHRATYLTSWSAVMPTRTALSAATEVARPVADQEPATVARPQAVAVAAPASSAVAAAVLTAIATTAPASAVGARHETSADGSATWRSGGIGVTAGTGLSTPDPNLINDSRMLVASVR
jgi:hypothetical protein